MKCSRRRLLVAGLPAAAVLLAGILIWKFRPFTPDVELMWETMPVQGITGSDAPNQKSSTPRAVAAAQRVFTAMPLAGLTRAEVVAKLGDPRTSSDSIYNFPFYPPQAGGSMVYRFDTGAGGWQFELVFDSAGKVSRVISTGIE